jgi:1D-myo-inositol-tetrakisphosphate 5-kinase/inositol-polyphosphate multikinase
LLATTLLLDSMSYMCRLNLETLLTFYSDGTLVDANRELFIKPCTPAEIEFYETSIAEHPDFYEYMPTYMGTLTLGTDQTATFEEQGASLIANVENGLVKASPLSKSKTKKIVTDRAIVLENSSAGFRRPNILDVKLGVRLYADDAALEKKIRFDKVTEETTHKKFGFRIAGMRVWQGHDASRDIGVDEDGFKSYDKDYGRLSVNNSNIDEPFRNFIFSQSAGIDQELGKLVVQAFLVDLEQIQKILENQESRMYSASLLFVFEGDGEALRSGMEEASAPHKVELNGANGHSSLDNVEGQPEDEEFSDEEEIAVPKIYSVKLIDFAHAEWVPGMGPDENALLGVRSVIKILKDLVK